MPHNLKLTIHQIGLRYKSKRNFLPFQQAFEHIIKREMDKDSIYTEFVKLYIESFNGAFKDNIEKTKSIIPENVGHKSIKNIITGTIKGGITGIEQEVYEKSKPQEVIAKIDREKITSLPHFFLLWTPVDLDTGILIMQSYSSGSVYSPFIENLQLFFRDYELTFTSHPFVPEKFKK